MIRLPKLYVFNPHARFSDTPKDWVSLPTPTCPDLEYVSLYYDSAEEVSPYSTDRGTPATTLLNEYSNDG